MQIFYNSRPTYVAIPVIHKVTRKPIPGRFQILEYRDGEIDFICSLGNKGDRLNNICKRGIPLDDARKLFYQMDN